MKSIQLFNVAPSMPEELRFLEALAHNLWWTWNTDAIDLFRRINPELWRETGRNPLEFLSAVPQARLEALAQNEGYRTHLASVRKRFDEALTPAAGKPATPSIAYFSLEYGIHESVRLYSGGLGALAGDHLKASSDLGLPLAAVGLMYRQGYFQQYLNREGWQQEYYPDNEVHCMPLSEIAGGDGRPMRVSIPLPEGRLHAAVWLLKVGRIPLYLLDANVQENSADLRAVTSKLYGGDRRTRLRQELLLGIGGYQMLARLGIDPSVCHMNEGHAAFLALARVAHLMKSLNLNMDEALEVTFRAGVFTTHTPVPAGNEAFPIDLIKPHLDVIERELGLPADSVLSLGQPPNGEGNPHELSMTVLGLRSAQFSNGVSELHGRVARRMWQHLWPERADDEVPIRHVTNGVHVASWLSGDMAAMFDRYLGDEWRMHPSDKRATGNIAHIPDEELWRTHELGRSRLVRYARELLEKQLRARNSQRAEIAQAKSVLDHNVLTIGFARRFATYKRAILLLRDPERFEAMLCNEDRPVQILFAGKAHPADHEGKEFIKRLVDFSQRPNIRRHVVFLENYDIAIARHLVQGVDIWLNTPRRPHEASGTSGMKAAVNGGINVSVLDGWWCEGYSSDCGWAIGAGEEYDDAEYQDGVESQALYNILENEAIPAFYDRETGDVPLRWLSMMKASIRMGLGFFTSHRMVEEYDVEFYGPAQSAFTQLTAEDSKVARQFVAQRTRLAKLWPGVRCSMPVTDHEMTGLHVGDRFTVRSIVTLGELLPSEVDVEVYYGLVNSENKIVSSQVDRMEMVKDRGNGEFVYTREVECIKTGRYGFTARVTPHGPEWKNVIPGFIRWADGA
jgi:starch phosphorylase